jgi:hypothetical protein
MELNMINIEYVESLGVVVKTECQIEAVQLLSDIEAWMEKHFLDGAERYFRYRFLPFWEIEMAGDLDLTQLLLGVEKRHSQRTGKHTLAELNEKRQDAMMTFATERAIRVLRPDTANVTPLRNLVSAREAFGTYKGIGVSQFMRVSVGELGEHGAKARHVRTYMIKDKVFAWAAENLSKYSSSSKAAHAVMKLEAIEHSTAYRYLREWRKSNPQK